MLTRIEIRTSGGVFLIGPFGMVPAGQRRVLSPADNLRHLFASRGAVEQLRRAWPQVPGVGNHRTALTDAAMRAQFENAVRSHAVTLVWVPRVPGTPPLAAIRARAPSAQPASGRLPSVAAMSVPDRIKAALIRSTDHLERDARSGAAAVRDAILNLTPAQFALIVGAFAIVFVPVVGEVVLALMLAYAVYEIGFHGTLAVFKLVRASATAAAAQSEAQIDAAARLYAEGFKDLGKAFFAYVLARLQVRAGGGRALGEAEAVVPRVARTAKGPGKVIAGPRTSAVAARPQSWFDDVARTATRNPESDSVVLGHFAREGTSYQKVAAHYKASYFKVEQWSEVTRGLSQDEIWRINETFLTQQIKQGKQVLFSQNPLTARPGSFFEKEVTFLKDLGYKFQQQNQWTWKAVR